MNAGNPVQIDLLGVSATRTKDTRLAEHGPAKASAMSNLNVSRVPRLGHIAESDHPRLSGSAKSRSIAPTLSVQREPSCARSGR
jgi:hypothetical protein